VGGLASASSSQSGDHLAMPSAKLAGCRNRARKNNHWNSVVLHPAQSWTTGSLRAYLEPRGFLKHNRNQIRGMK
jgi:hypothetical protein